MAKLTAQQRYGLGSAPAVQGGLSQKRKTKAITVSGKPKKFADGGKVEGDGYMKKPEIEAAQRQDAAELVTEYAARKHASTGNDVGRVGYHAGQGDIYDSTVVGRIPAGGGFRKHEKADDAEAKETPKPKNDLQRTVNGAPIRNPRPANIPTVSGVVRG